MRVRSPIWRGAVGHAEGILRAASPESQRPLPQATGFGRTAQKKKGPARIPLKTTGSKTSTAYLQAGDYTPSPLPTEILARRSSSLLFSRTPDGPGFGSPRQKRWPDPGE